jgi:hypothetical protein
MHSKILRIGWLCILALGACETYDPPPEAFLAVPEKGTYEVGEPLLITFSEPINPESLLLRVWPAGPEDITIEGEFVAGLKPVLETCSISDCSGAELTINEDNSGAELTLSDPAFDEAKVAWVLEIASGLKDTAGRTTGAAYHYDFQFMPSTQGNGDPIEFESGVYHMVADIEKPLPVVLSLYLDMQIHEDGDGRIVGAKVKALGQAPKNTTNPDELALDTTDNGFVLFGVGKMTANEGERFFATEPTDLQLAFGPIKLTLSKLRINTAVVKHPETGNDRLEGTLTFAKAVLDSGGSEPTEFDAAVNSFFADRVPVEYVTEDYPRVCGDLCGAVPKQCNPPIHFPGDGFCPE